MAKYIDIEKAKEVIRNYGKGAISDGLKILDPVDDIFYIQKALEFIPAADAQEVKHGKWIKDRNCRTCSECDFKYYDNGGLFNYCPHCGAKMNCEDNV